MMEVENWMLKHCTQELNMIKCNYCEETFSDYNRMQNFNYHLCNMHNVIELDEHPECDNIRQNYKISSPMATCNHCKKTINFAFHGVHVLTIHLKIFHTNKLKIKISNVQDKYDILGDKATCKGCKETLKTNNATLSLHQHLHHCPHFKTDFPLKKVENQQIEKKRSHVWDKYDVIDNNATCKGCKKTLKIYEKYSTLILRKHLHYCPHFKIDFPLKNIFTKIHYTKTKKLRIWNKFNVIDGNAKCNGCKQTYKLTRVCIGPTLLKHLRYCFHFKTDFPLENVIRNNQRKSSRAWKEYDVIKSNATCKGCKKTIKIIGKYASSTLLNHLRRCLYFKIDFPFENVIPNDRKRSHAWDKYDIIDSNATCIGCKKIIKITGNYPLSTLTKHLRRCAYFKIDFLLKKKNNQQIEEETSYVWDKYDVIDSNVICKGCKNTLKITEENATSVLYEHSRHCRSYFRRYFPNIYFLNKRQIIRKKSHAWDKYDIIGSNAMCKGCKRTIKINKRDVSYLRQHLFHCSHFKVHFPLKKEVSNLTQRSSHVWNNYDVIDNNATCKGCKKTLQIKITSIYATQCLRQHLNYCPHFKTNFPRNKEIPYESTQKRSQVWNKYDIKDNNATCKGCKKTLKTKVTSIHIASALNRHLHYCSHFQTDFPRKKVVREKHEIKNKKSRVWDKYDVIDNNATCKGCKKILKINWSNAASMLLKHLHICPRFKTDFPLNKEITYDITRKKSHVWTKYDITDNTVTCKGCKKTLNVKVTSIYAIAALSSHIRHCPHFRTDSPRKKVNTYHTENQQLRGKKSDVWDKYDVIDGNAICKGCKKTLKITRHNTTAKLHKHLHHCPQFRTDFPGIIIQNESHIWDKYDVTDSNATCKGCKETIEINCIRPALRLLEHLHHCPDFGIDFPKKRIRRKTSHAWDKYDVTGSDATCKGCKKTIKIRSNNAASHLLQHLQHCPHFKKNFPKKLKK